MSDTHPEGPSASEPQASPRGPDPWNPYAQPGQPDPLSELFQRVWPPIQGTASGYVLAMAAIAGVLGASLLPFQPYGLNAFIVSLAVVAIAAPAARRAATTYRIALWAGTVLLLAVPIVRDSNWLAVLCLLGAIGLVSFTTARGRSWAAMLAAGPALLVAGVRSVGWSVRSAARLRPTERRDLAWPVLRTALISIGLLAVFGALFASADPTFAGILGGMIPELDVPGLALRVFIWCLVAGAALAVACSAAAPAELDEFMPPPGRGVRRAEWLVPIGSLVALFLGFVVVQVSELFRSQGDLVRVPGLTYAEYVHQGFAQLVVVTVLTLGVLAAAVRKAPRSGKTDTILVRGLLGALCALSLVIAASALWGLKLYVDAYGLTELRLLVATFELWLVVVFLLVLVAGAPRGRLLPLPPAGSWLPSTLVASAAVALITLAVVNPGAVIARYNVERFEVTGKIDLAYLEDLSADAVPALNQLPEPHRSCALEDIADKVAERDPWFAVNIARVRARTAINADPPKQVVNCFDLSSHSPTRVD